MYVSKWVVLFVAGLFAVLVLYRKPATQVSKIAVSATPTSTLEPTPSCEKIKSTNYSPKVKQILLSGYGCISPIPSPTVSQVTTPTRNGLRERKGMSCQPIGNDGQMDCQEYDTWYDPNATPEPLDPGMMQGH